MSRMRLTASRRVFDVFLHELARVFSEQLQAVEEIHGAPAHEPQRRRSRASPRGGSRASARGTTRGPRAGSGVMPRSAHRNAAPSSVTSSSRAWLVSPNLAAMLVPTPMIRPSTKAFTSTLRGSSGGDAFEDAEVLDERTSTRRLHARNGHPGVASEVPVFIGARRGLEPWTR